MPKAYSYLRFSTPEQMQGDSFRRQSQLATEYAARHGLELDSQLTFHDLGVSAFRGKNAEAGRLADFLDAVRRGLVPRGSFLLVESLDRISRQAARKALRVLEEICEEDIAVVTLTDGRTYTTQSLDSDPMSLVLSLLTFIRANEESATKARRLAAAWEAKRSNATQRPLTRVCPAWLEWSETKGRFVALSERAKIVRRIFRDALKGFGQHTIAARLNADGVPAFGGRGREGRFWQRSYVLKVLKNSAVVGTLVPHKVEHANGRKRRVPQTPIQGYFPPVVDQEVFERVQGLLAAASQPLRGRHTNSGAGQVANVLGGLAKCPECGSTMTVVNKTGAKDSRPYRYFVCTKAKAGAGCTYRTVPYSVVESELIEGWPALLADCPPQTEQGAKIVAEIDGIEAQDSALVDELESLMEALRMSSSAPATIVGRIAEIETTREEMQKRVTELSAQLPQFEQGILNQKLAELDSAMTTVRDEQLPPGPARERTALNALLRQVYRAVTVDYRTGTLELEWLHGGWSRVVFAWGSRA